MSEADSVNNVLDFAPEPINYTYGWDTDPANISANNFGVEASFNMDLAIGYKVLLFYMVRMNENLLIMNPQAFMEAASHSWVSFHLNFVEIKLLLNMNAYKFTPADF